jgi:hypothetical protein
VRIIPTDGRPFSGDAIRPWLGVSRGRWEGDTLVVETRNFHPESNYEGSGPNRVVIEKFTRTGPDSMSYEFTVTDPTTWARPFTGEVPWKMDEGPRSPTSSSNGPGDPARASSMTDSGTRGLTQVSPFFMSADERREAEARHRTRGTHRCTRF